MNPFAHSLSNKPSSLRSMFSGRLAWLTLVICLGLGLVVVVWRERSQRAAAQAQARTEAMARGLAIESQFSQATAALEVLGALVNQTRGVLPNFPQVAAQLLAVHPAVATLELQPRGVVANVVPRAGNERALGFDVLKDPQLSPGAYAAIRGRRLTVSGPLRLPHGEAGLIARLPIFQRGRDGKEYFWGFVAASIRLPDLLARARLADLVARGYDYVFYGPPTAQQAAVSLAAHGKVSSRKAVVLPVHAQNVQFGIAVQPRGDWFNTMKLALEILAVGGLAIMVSLLVSFFRKGNDLQAAFAQAKAELAQVAAEQERGQDELHFAREAATAAQQELEQLKSNAADLGEQLEEASRTAEAAANDQAAKLRQAQATNSELQAQAEADTRNARTTEESLRAQLAEANTTIDKLQTQLEAAIRNGEEATRTAQDKFNQQAQVSAELESRLQEAAANAQTMESASAARLQAAEQTIGNLEARWAAATEAPTEVASAAATTTSSEEANDSTAGVTGSEEVNEPETQPEEADTDFAGSAPPADPPAAPVDVASNERAAASGFDIPAADEAGNEPGQTDEMPPDPDAGHVAIPPDTERPSENSSDSDVGVEVPPSNNLDAAPPEVRTPNLPPTKSDKPARRRKKRDKHQLSLFDEETDGVQSVAVDELASKPPTQEPAAETHLAEATAPVSSNAPVEVLAPEAGSSSATVEFSQVNGTIGDVQPSASESPELKTNKAAASLAADLDLPKIDGLNPREGLVRFDADPKLYLKALRQFVDQHTRAPEQIRDFLVQGDATGAQRRTIVLKHAAQALGAGQVQVTAANLERGIQAESDPTDIETLWAELEDVLNSFITDLKSALKPREDKPAKLRQLPPTPPVDLAQLRTAIKQILPLLADEDPGAKDCLKDNRTTFRSAFTPETFVEFEQCVKQRSFAAAFEQLKKAVKKHGIHV